MQTCRHFVIKPYFKPFFMSAFVCKGKNIMSAFIFQCRHADIKVYNFTIVITTIW